MKKYIRYIKYINYIKDIKYENIKCIVISSKVTFGLKLITFNFGCVMLRKL